MSVLAASPAPPPEEPALPIIGPARLTLFNAWRRGASYLISQSATSEQEIRHTTAILPPTLICQVTLGSITMESPKDSDQRGFTPRLPLQQGKWGGGGGLLLYSVENFSEDEFPFLFLMVSVRLFLTPCFTVLICCV